jgi:hypothetical protein|tara:strand:+ start:322 stop:555 length:234 start_codon:yes stop_codon:yes gene_type:complete
MFPGAELSSPFDLVVVPDPSVTYIPITYAQTSISVSIPFLEVVTNSSLQGTSRIGATSKPKSMAPVQASPSQSSGVK